MARCHSACGPDARAHAPSLITTGRTGGRDGLNCIFCRIAQREIPAQVVREDEDTVAFRDLNPKAPVHVLVIPRRHIGSVNDLTTADRAVVGALFVAARAVAESEHIADSGYRLVMNTGGDAGQTVQHIHLHVLGGRELHWPPG